VANNAVAQQSCVSSCLTSESWSCIRAAPASPNALEMRPTACAPPRPAPRLRAFRGCRARGPRRCSPELAQIRSRCAQPALLERSPVSCPDEERLCPWQPGPQAGCLWPESGVRMGARRPVQAEPIRSTWMGWPIGLQAWGKAMSVGRQRAGQQVTGVRRGAPKLPRAKSSHAV
jgi:hypothetical protein